MGSTTAKEYYRRRLPHYQPADATFFVTFRLSGSLPDETIVLLKQEHEALEKKLQLVSGKAEREKLLKQSQQQYFGRFDEYLDKISTGPKWLAQSKIAKLVAEAMHYRNEKDDDLLAYCIMPNHVHIVFSLVASSEEPIIETVGRLAESPELRDGVSHYIITNIMGNLKKYTALRANRLLHRCGAFWQHESYDHVVRNDGELERIIQNVAYNPVKAGLCKDWRDWKWTYVKEGLMQL